MKLLVLIGIALVIVGGILVYRYYRSSQTEEYDGELPSTFLPLLLIELSKTLGEYSKLEEFTEEQVQRLVDQFVAIMVMLELVFDELFIELFADEQALVEDVKPNALSELVKRGFLSQKQADTLIDAMTLTAFFVSQENWIDTYPDLPMVDELTEKLPSYYDALFRVHEIAQDAQAKS